MSAKPSAATASFTINAPLATKNADFWIEHRLNVLLRGKHGTGKSTLVIEAFNRHNLKWKYFSAATLDPWVDFVGVPKEVTDASGNVYLDLVRPKEFAADEVEAIFIDEFNRGAKKVKNAVMELLQFKSINGKKFTNLKIVWAAINPDDDSVYSYDVEKMDPAQLDRFHIHIDMPYQPDLAYFTAKYGTEIAESVCEWWHGQDDKVKNAVSPRRLDYAVEIGLKPGSCLREVLPNLANVTELTNCIDRGSYLKHLRSTLDTNDPKALKAFVNDENTFKSLVPLLEREPEYTDQVVPALEPEKASMLISKSEKVLDRVFPMAAKIPVLKTVFKDVRAAKVNQPLISKLDGREMLCSLSRTDFSNYLWATEALPEDLESLFDEPKKPAGVATNLGAPVNANATEDRAEVLFSKEDDTFALNSAPKRLQFVDNLVRCLYWDIPANRVYPLYVGLVHVLDMQYGGDGNTTPTLNAGSPQHEKLMQAVHLYNYLIAQVERYNLRIDGLHEKHHKLLTHFSGLTSIKMPSLKEGKAKKSEIRSLTDNLRGLRDNEEGKEGQESAKQFNTSNLSTAWKVGQSKHDTF